MLIASLVSSDFGRLPFGMRPVSARRSVSKIAVALVCETDTIGVTTNPYALYQSYCKSGRISDCTPACPMTAEA
jgi:hypothetical protein